jgi:hypothetical protein
MEPGNPMQCKGPWVWQPDYTIIYKPREVRVQVKVLALPMMVSRPLTGGIVAEQAYLGRIRKVGKSFLEAISLFFG